MCNDRIKRRNKTLSADEFHGYDNVWLCGLMPFKLLLTMHKNTIKHGNNAASCCFRLVWSHASREREREEGSGDTANSKLVLSTEKCACQ